MSKPRSPGHDRDSYTPKTPPRGVQEQIAAPEFVEEESSAAYSHDPVRLREYRSRRSTDERLESVETKYDELVERVMAAHDRAESRRTKVLIALVGLGSAIAGYLLGGCVVS